MQTDANKSLVLTRFKKMLPIVFYTHSAGSLAYVWPCGHYPAFERSTPGVSVYRSRRTTAAAFGTLASATKSCNGIRYRVHRMVRTGYLVGTEVHSWFWDKRTDPPLSLEHVPMEEATG